MSFTRKTTDMGATADPKALYQISYGLYVITTNDGKKDNGCIVNSVMRLSGTPRIVGVSVNKQSYTWEIIQKKGVLNVNTLTDDVPFEFIGNFGYKSGRDVDKFAGYALTRSKNGLAVLPEYTKGFLSLAVTHEISLGSHTLFLCRLTDGKITSDKKALTYSHYQAHIKPKNTSRKKQGFVCRVCGYIHEGTELPEGFICPVCKQGPEAFDAL